MNVARCAIFTAPNQPFEFSELPLPPCGPGEALVKLSLATICGSDLHTADGKRAEPSPSVLGHEGVGHVVALGTNRDQNLLGQRVTWTIMDSCGHCVPCREWELPQKCAHLFKYGHSEMTNGCGLNGCYSTHILLRPGTLIIPIPDALPNEMAAPANCALATMVGAIEPLPRSCRVAVIQGAGMLGLYGCALLRAKGVEKVVVVDTNPARLELVEAFGGKPALKTAGDLVPPGSADAVFEVAGTAAVVPQGVRHLRVGGDYAFIGMVTPTTPLDVPGHVVTRQCLTLRGFHNYAPRHLVAAVKFLAEHAAELPWKRFISPAFALSEINEAFAEARTRKWLRVAVRPLGGQ
jgi:putative phosphonate catabolism associated alcohol dehydrogenase